MIYIGGGAGMAPLRAQIFHLFHTEKQIVKYRIGMVVVLKRIVLCRALPQNRAGLSQLPV